MPNVETPYNPKGNLSKKVARGGFWVFSLRGFSQLFAIARLIILARILVPSDFGLMGIALLTISALEAFSLLGIQQSLVQKKEDIKEYLNTAWIILIIRGIILFAFLYVISPYVAVFFNTPEAKTIIQVIGFSFLIQAFTNIGIVCFQKELEFDRQFIYQLSGTLTDFVFTVSAVFILKNVWALVIGLLAGNITRCIVSYVIHPYRPRLQFDLKKAIELFGFGKWILGSSILIFIGLYIDNICVGKLLGAATLGLYVLAYQISNVPATEITKIVSGVAFPAYSKIQDSPTGLQQAYFQTARLTTAISIPLAIVIIALAQDFTRIFLGEKWLPMVPAMQLLTFAGLLKSIISTGSPLFMGSGRPKYEFYTQLLRGIIIVLTIYPLTRYLGISGAAVSVILSMLGMLVLWYTFSQHITRGSWKIYANTFLIPVLSSLFMAMSIYVVKLFMIPMYVSQGFGVIVFLGISIISICIYVAWVYVIQKYYHAYNIADDVKLIYRSLVRT